MEQLVHEQHAILRRLYVFIDDLRDLKTPKEPEQGFEIQLVKIARRFCCDGSLELQDEYCDAIGATAARALASTLQQLTHCIQRIDHVQMQLSAQSESQNPPSRSSESRPVAPPGLLSLRDYSVLQAAIEVFVCWALYPAVLPGVLLPLNKRRPTRTLQISMQILQWRYSSQSVESQRPNADQDLLSLVQMCSILTELLLLPQFRPILLPKYLVELFSLLIYGEHCIQDPSFRPLYEKLIRALPLRLVMTTLRACLAQSTAHTSDIIHFKTCCGRLLSDLVMQQGGVQATVEMLLSSVDEGNTQARMQVATLISKCPAGTSPTAYLEAICPQLITVFHATGTQQKLLGEMAALTVNQLVVSYGDLMDLWFFRQALGPLLAFDESTESDMASGLVVSEEQLEWCVEIIEVLLGGPPPSHLLLAALVPVVRALVHLYAFASNCKSYLAERLQRLLLVWIRMSPKEDAATLLQLSILPCIPPRRSALNGDATQSDSTIGGVVHVFCSGGHGGVAIKRSKAEETDGLMNDPMMITWLVKLLEHKDLESSQVVGELFCSLLHTYTGIRRATSTDQVDTRNVSIETMITFKNQMSMLQPFKLPKEPRGMQNVMTLLLGLLESLGARVLQSATSILTTLVAVLETFCPAHQPSRLVDQMGSSIDAANEDQEDDLDILSICLGLVGTILEAGATIRPVEEEAILQTMNQVLETLSSHEKPEIAEMASNTRVQILFRRTDSVSTSPSIRSKTPFGFEEILAQAREELQSSSVPVRAHGIVTLTKLVRQSQSDSPTWKPDRIEALLGIYLNHLLDPESYVYLAAVQGLASLGDFHADVAIPLLVRELRNEQDNSTEKRIKLSEALLFTARRCGELMPKYGKLFVYAYLDCIRPPAATNLTPQLTIPSPKPVALIQVVKSDEPLSEPATSHSESVSTIQLQGKNQLQTTSAASLAQTTLRASCLSNLAEVCALLRWSLDPFAADVVTCVYGIVQLECVPPANDANAKSPTTTATANARIQVRRGAVFVLYYVLHTMGHLVLEVLADQLKPMYHLLKHVEHTERDAVTRFHTQRALQELDNIMRHELFGNVAHDAISSSLYDRLRIVH